MGAINNIFNQASWSILQLANAASKYTSGRNKEGQNKAKQNYNWAATIKKQNNELVKTQVETLKSYFGYNYSIPPERDEQKIAEQEVLRKMAQEKPKAAGFDELLNSKPNMDEQKAAGFDELLNSKPNMDEQKAAEQKALEKMEEEKTKATGFGELPTVNAEHSETNIDANDPEVQGLINAKQKNIKRSISASRAQKEYQASKGYEKDFPIRDYMPNVSDGELRKAGITKTELNKLSSILAGNGTEEDVIN